MSYPVKSAMKKTAFIALFSGMVLSAGAQNTNRITEEEPDIKVTEDTVRNTAIEEKVQQKYRFLPPPAGGQNRCAGPCRVWLVLYSSL